MMTRIISYPLVHKSGTEILRAYGAFFFVETPALTYDTHLTALLFRHFLARKHWTSYMDANFGYINAKTLTWKKFVRNKPLTWALRLG